MLFSPPRPGTKFRYDLNHRSRSWLTLTLFLIAAYVFLFSLISIRRHQTFNSGFYDLGVFEQVLWNTSRGRILASTLVKSGLEGGNFLNEQFSLVLLLLAPFYGLFPKTEFLLISQTFFLGIGAWAVSLLAQRVFGSGFLAFVFSLMYLLNPSLQLITLYDFHIITLIVPLLLFAFYFLLADRGRLFLLLVFLALLVKQEVMITVFALGLYLIFIRKKPRLGAVVCLTAALWFLIWAGFILPRFSPGGYYHLYRYSHFGRSFGEIALNMARYPNLVLTALLQEEKITFFLSHLAFLGFLPLFGGGAFLLTIPAFFYLLVSNYYPHWSLLTHYSSILLPTLFFAAILGFRKISSFGQKPANLLLIFSLVLTLAADTSFSLPSLWFSLGRSSFSKNPHQEIVRQALELIPPKASVGAGQSVGAHLARREKLYLFYDWPKFKPEYLITDVSRPGEPVWFGKEEYFKRLEELKAGNEYEFLFGKEGVLLYRRKF